jgi:hypothetical protein
VALVGEDAAAGACGGVGVARDRVQRSRARDGLECSRRLRAALRVQNPRAVRGVAVGTLRRGFIAPREGGVGLGRVGACAPTAKTSMSMPRCGAHAFGLAELADLMGARWVARQPTRLVRRCSVRRRSGRCHDENGRRARRRRRLVAARSPGEGASPSPQLRPVSVDCQGSSGLAGYPHESLKTSYADATVRFQAYDHPYPEWVSVSVRCLLRR